MYILCSLLLCVFVFCGIGIFFDESMKKAAGVLIPISLAGSAFLIFALMQVEEKVVIDKYSVRKISRWVNREILLKDLKGFRTDKNYLYILPHKGMGKKIRVSTYFSGLDRLRDLLSQHAPDLDMVVAQADYEESISAFTDEELKPRLKQARIETHVLTAAMVAIPVISFFTRKQFSWLMVTPIIIVILSILLLIRHKGLVKLDTSDKNDPLPSIALIPIISIAALLFFTKYLMSINIADGKAGLVWTPALCIAVGMTLLLWLCSKYLNRKKTSYIFAFFLMAGVFIADAFFTIELANSVLDNSEAEYFEATVSKRDVVSGKTRTFYLYVNTREHPDGTEKIESPRLLYELVNVGDKVGLYYRKGAFDIPWYTIGRARR